MNYRKIFFVVAVLSLTGCSSFKNKIGEMRGNQFVITADTEHLRVTWNAILVENKINGTLTRSSFAINKDLDTNEKSNEYYFLTSTSTNDSVKVSTLLLKKSNRFYFPNLKEQRIIICHGTTDCVPKIFKHNNWGCDCEPESLFDCKKASVVLIKQ